jgi:hypothetical protein
MIKYMSKNIFKSDRYFKIADFLISHGQLLLRSDKTNEQKTNIDIIFFDAIYMQLLGSLQGITIREADNNQVVNYVSVISYLIYDHNHLFEIETQKGEKYYVAASFVKIFENELGFGETSLGVFQHKGREKEIATSL